MAMTAAEAGFDWIWKKQNRARKSDTVRLLVVFNNCGLVAWRKVLFMLFRILGICFQTLNNPEGCLNMYF
ncbi:MAG: hypothetical protein A2X11_11475 [Bacteroidetes bacterium GWE2_42_24]|nr:MAG: hypothetical protein A2X11_11475 [Bacteroidetes bacterium GWE2_42_24]OFY25529.1 MAG: hypothetical protein A2X09_07075 [Bacteroidetes bacterium GWF2_43_11]PKP23262.1 MAG: hypothetical protein CVU06_08905 [Bacteroidetes bacterium HGW-Bacteroidetes-22]